MNHDLTNELQDRVHAALGAGTPLALIGHGTKSFFGRVGTGEPLALSDHAGILNYQPQELVITARGGTTLVEIEAALAEHGQMLPFDPPHFATDGRDATLGGTVACGLSGPARPSGGAARDLVLGARVLTGRGEVLRFGGEVMKNVAGYDVSRLMVGALGTLGILLDVSIKVMPVPPATRTLVHDGSLAEALARMTAWALKPLPITATCCDGERLWVRLSGTAQGVDEAAGRLGGEQMDDDVAESFWRDQVREHGHPFFAGDRPLWRLSLPPATPDLALPGRQLIEWGGSQRWLRGDAAEGATIRERVAAVGGHATLFRGGDRTGEVFHPLPAGLMRLHRQLKQSFDPGGILNPGRLYAGL